MAPIDRRSVMIMLAAAPLAGRTLAASPAVPDFVFQSIDGGEIDLAEFRGGPVLEFVAHDPRQGAMFYTLEQSASGVPRFERNDTCVMCHASDATHNVPGMFVGSVFPSPEGTTMYGPAYTTDHRSPFELRWGGWFVTGTHHASRHMGNAIATDPADLGPCDLVVEAVIEELDAKADLLGKLGEVCPRADLASTTSSLSVATLADRCGHPHRLFGLHVFNPVHRMELVELCLPDGLRDGIGDRARAWCRGLGKTPIEVPDQPGFVVNRLLFPYLFDAVRLAERTGMPSVSHSP